MIINNHQEYETALKEFEILFSQGIETGPRYFELFDAIEKYEDLKYPINEDMVDKAKELVEGVDVDFNAPLRREDE